MEVTETLKIKGHVIHGFQQSAGQPSVICKELRKLGWNAKSVCVGTGKFKYDSDLQFSSKGTRIESYGRAVGEGCDGAHIIHIHGAPPFYTGEHIKPPFGMELSGMRFAGAKIIYHLRGSEIRDSNLVKKINPFHYLHANEKSVKNFPHHWQNSFKNFLHAFADRVLVVDAEVARYYSTATIINRAIDIDQWKYKGVGNTSDKPVIVHAPSRRVVKGSEYILNAVDNLEKAGLSFDFHILENMTNSEVREKLENADIVIDQLRIGAYGVLAVEAMALGKIVLAYLDDDIIDHYEGHCPIINVNRDDIEDQLRMLIINWSKNIDKMKDIGERSRDFCEQVHCSKKIARKLDKIYSEVIDQNSRFRKDLFYSYLSIFFGKEKVDYTVSSVIIKQLKKVKILVLLVRFVRNRKAFKQS